MKKASLLFLAAIALFTFQTAGLSAQQKSRVAVLPFTAVEVSPSEAKVVTSLFETALVKTGVYNVIEQNQIADILKAQAFSLSGCTDDACAVEVGKLLAAELIVLGEISRVGGQYIATAKLIDVGLGRNVNADSVTAATIAEMTNQAITLLAYKLAGLTYSAGGGERIAEAFGEIYVSTVPDGAEVFVNGMRRGTSPLLIDKVPLGTARVTARRDNLSGESVVTLSGSGLVEVEIQLKVSLGRLFIKSSEKDVEVFLDGRSLGPLGGGLFKDLPSGEHTLTLKGNGVFWEGPVVIEAEKSVSVEAYPRAFGTLRYTLPEGAVLEISGGGTDAGAPGQKRLTGSGTVDLAVGSYVLSVSGNRYVPLKDRVSIERGRTVSFSPKPEYTDAYRAALEEAERASAHDDFEKRLEILRISVESDEGSADEASAELEEARALYAQIDDAGYEFPDLRARAAELTVRAIINRIEELEALSRAAEERARKKAAGRWVSIGVGAAGFAVSGIFYFLGAEEYETYLAARTTTASEASHATLQTYAILQTGGLIVGGAGGLLTLVLSGKPKSSADYSVEIARLSAERAALEGGVR